MMIVLLIIGVVLVVMIGIRVFWLVVDLLWKLSGAVAGMFLIVTLFYFMGRVGAL